MKFKIGRSKLTELKVVGVVIFRAPVTGDILYTSGKLYFASKEQYRIFKHKMLVANPEAIVKRVFIKRAKPPEYFKIDDEYMAKMLKMQFTYCPYCGCIEHWNWNHHCPVCNMSDEDFYVKTYNNSWRNGLSNIAKD